MWRCGIASNSLYPDLSAWDERPALSVPCADEQVFDHVQKLHKALSMVPQAPKRKRKALNACKMHNLCITRAER